MIADILTKALSNAKHVKCVKLLNSCDRDICENADS